MEFNIKTNALPADFYHIGEEFRLAASRCYGEESDGSYKLMDCGRINILPSATVVNAAFSCEMFLKSLLKYKTIEIGKIHSLCDLFRLLPMDLKEAVALYCGGTAVSDFEDVLEQHAKAFITARYYVEHNEWYGMSPAYLLSLAYNLSQITKAIINEWDIHRVLEKLKAEK